MKLPTTVHPPLLDRPLWQRFVFTGGLLVVAIALGRLSDPNSLHLLPLATSYVAVTIAAWVFGLGPAIVASVAGGVAAFWPYAVTGNALTLLGTAGVARIALYAFACVATSWLCESLRRTQRDRAAAEQRSAAILENMGECFCSVDAGWRLTYVNPSAERYLRINRTQVRDRTVFEAIGHLRGSACERNLQRAMEQQQPSRFECTEIVPNQVTLVSTTPLAGGMAMFLRDVTAERRHVQQLENEVAARTAELRETIADLETFSYTLVHDMRAPLRAIRLSVEMLSTDHVDGMPTGAAAQLKRIGQTADRMDRLIVDVLNYSRLTRQSADLRTVDLDALVRDLIGSQSAFAADKADINVESPLPPVRGNEALLGQCFVNLLQNATKFVAPGVRPSVRIMGTRNGDGVRVVVEDNGIGVPAEATERIFEPFQREDARYEGNGIGLAIVRKVVERLAGRVGVESTPGSGSRFWIELPGAEATSPSGSSRAAPTAAEPVGGAKPAAHANTTAIAR